MQRISIGSWSFALGPYADNPEPWTPLLQKLKRLGFGGIEVAGFSIHPRPENQPTKEARGRIRCEAQDMGISFSSYIPDLWNQKLISTDEPAGYIRAFQRGVEFAFDIGANKVCIDTLEPPEILYEVDYKTALTRVATTWKTCAKIAADYDCSISWEFEPIYVLNKPSDVIRIVETVNEDNFGILFDTCLAEMIGRFGMGQVGSIERLPGGCLEYARLLRGKINHCHFMDCDGVLHSDGGSNQCAFGEGTLDLGAVASEVFRFNPTNWLVIDPGLPLDAWSMATRCMNYLNDGKLAVV